MNSFPELPIQVQEAAQDFLQNALADVYRPGTTARVDGFLVASHTLGSQYQTGSENIRMGLWYLFGDYAEDGASVIIGDPAQGAFVSISPPEEVRTMMGAEELIELGRRVKKTIPLVKAEKIAKGVEQWLKPHIAVGQVAGSIRRKRPDVGDIEFVVLPKDLPEFLRVLDEDGWVGADRIRKKVVKGILVELYIAHKPEELGAMIFAYTGDWLFNVAMRSIAKRRGFKLDQYGFWDADSGKIVFQSPDEREFFDFLGVRWHAPQDRSFKDRPKKKAAMGAELLIELGADQRKVGHITLELEPDPSVEPMVWVLKVERIDPFGGDSWKGEFAFRDENAAHYWYSQGIQGDEDIDQLIRIFQET